MQTVRDKPIRSEGPAPAATRRAADAVLREHPDALIFAQSAEGRIVPVPASLGLDGYEVLSEEGRTGVDLCVAEDRMAVVNAWMELKSNGVAEVRARLRSDPATWRTVRMLDLRRRHGVVLTIGWVSEDQGATAGAPADTAPVSTAPRFGTRRQDGEGNVLACDRAYLQMLGFADEREVVGAPTFERVHEDDQARLIESWVAMIATGRPQIARVRMRRGDGSWLWVDTTYHNCLDDAEGGYVVAECVDVSAEMAAQEALRDREELLRHLLEELPDGLLQVDREGRPAYRNGRLTEILAPGRGGGDAGAAAREAPLALDELLAGFDDAQPLHDAITAALARGESADVELVARGDGGQRHILFKVRPLLRDGRLVTGAIVSVQDVTDVACARLELERRASTDPLTGAFNRAAIVAALEAELREHGAAAVVYVDLDRFKEVNDSFGHAAGDELLVQVSGRLRTAMRAHDSLGRLGGDEFLLLLRGADGRDAAAAAGERVSATLRGTYSLSAAEVELVASVGVAFTEHGRVGADELIELADAAMYRSKRARRGSPVLASG